MNLKNLFKATFALVLCLVVFASCDIIPGSGQTEDNDVYLFGNCKQSGMHGYTMGITDGRDHTYSAASMLDGIDLFEKAKYIVGIRAYIGDEVKNGCVWVGEDYENPTYTQEFTYKQGGWQYVMFDEPIKLNNQDIYIGYTVTGEGSILAAESASKAHKTEWICLEGQWQLLSKAAGKALWSIQAIVTGGDYKDENQHDLVVECVTMPKRVTSGEPINVTCEVRNAGIKQTGTVEVECVIGGSSVSVTVPEKLMNGQSAFITFPVISAPNAGGSVEASVIATEAGVTEDREADNTVKKTLSVYSETVARNCIYIEQFTGQDCPNCPGGSKAMSEAIAKMTNPNAAVWVAHHTYGTDQFTINGSLSIANYLYVNAAPQCNINRLPMDYGMGVEELIWHPGYATKAILERALNEPGLATIELSRTYNAETRELAVEVKGRAIEKDAYITAIVTQSGIVARQSGATGEYVHNNAPRAFLTAPKGDKLELDAEGNYTVTYTYTIPATVGSFECLPENMDVAVLVHGNISDPESRLVYNADQVSVVPEVSSAAMRAMSLYTNDIDVDIFNVELKPVCEQICR
jgi:hypothetical protein